MDARDVRRLRRELRTLAREVRLPAAAVDAALECGVLSPAAAAGEHRYVLRQMRRIMLDLGVNAPGAALLVRLRRDVVALQAEVERLRRIEAIVFAAWDDWETVDWRELEEEE